MADIVLFHHVQGLTSGVRELGASLAGSDHHVHTPDLFNGRTFATIPEGMAHLEEELGFPAMVDRARAAVAGLPADAVYAGISMGAIPAELMFLSRPGSRGLVLLESCVPVEFIVQLGGRDPWPRDVPFQIHGMDGDPFFSGEGDIEVARGLVTAHPGGELFTYPGDVHLFCDASLSAFDPAATALVLERVGTLLADLGD